MMSNGFEGGVDPTDEFNKMNSIFQRKIAGFAYMAKSPRLQAIPFIDGFKVTEIQDVPLEDIDSDDRSFQYRLSANLGDLKHSLSHEGQKEPVDLTGSKPYRIIDGFRRIGAVKILRWPTVKALVHKGISDEEAHKLAFIKNVVRKNLSPMDKANAIFQAKQRGMKAGDLMEYFGLSDKQLKRYEALLEFPAEVQKRLDKREITMAHAKVLSDFKVKNMADWVTKVSENGLSAKQLKKELKKASGARQVGREKLYMRKEKGKIRVFPFTVAKDASRVEKDKVIKILQDAIDVLKG
jgi:ParB/RepB/Spo0J family partition protein